MATKTITITQDAYDLLVQQKRKNESFSQVIKRVIPSQNDSLFHYVGILSEHEAKQMHNDIATIRDKHKGYRL
ncbi:MAG: antitoxin VapB family protein [Candidatus Woesearchaeota archaeon]